VALDAVAAGDGVPGSGPPVASGGGSCSAVLADGRLSSVSHVATTAVVTPPINTASPAVAGTSIRRRARRCDRGVRSRTAVGASAPSRAWCERTSRVVAEGQVWVDGGAA
jgi:hypothetical protein